MQAGPSPGGESEGGPADQVADHQDEAGAGEVLQGGLRPGDRALQVPPGRGEARSERGGQRPGAPPPPLQGVQVIMRMR